jgi:type IV secretory pathway VirD2 relaxase
MVDDDDLEPRLGRISRGRGPSARRYAGAVLAATNLARGGPRGTGAASRFAGHRNGRGAGIGRLLASRDRHALYRRRRVVVKARIVRLGGGGIGGAKAHLRYLQRDGTTREGERGQLYGAQDVTVDGQQFLGRSEGDRHQFRFIVAPEDGAQYSDLRPLVRRLMTRMEGDLGTRLDWIAVDHFNTGHPHSHILLRGVDDRGKDLVIARDYISQGLRGRAAELVDLDLGPRSDREIRASRRAEIGQARWTSIDRTLVRAADAERMISPRARDPFEHDLRAGRLAQLGRMGVADPVGAGRWQLAADLEATLRAMGEKGDIIRTLQREYARASRPLVPSAMRIHDPALAGDEPLTGRVLARGLADEHAGREYLIVEGVDGNSHYVALGKAQVDGGGPESLPDGILPGTIVDIRARSSGLRPADRTIAAIARNNGGLYDRDAHLDADPTASPAFLDRHERRLEALRRPLGLTRTADGAWMIPADHLERVMAHEAGQARDRPVMVELRAPVPLERMTGAHATTWLDHLLVGDGEAQLRDAGFGAEARAALAARRAWLIGEGLARQEGATTHYVPRMLGQLQQRELGRVAERLARQMALPYRDAGEGERIEGRLVRRLDLISGRFALLENSYEFTLVPWRGELDRRVGQSVSGRLVGGEVDWRFGRGRAGPGLG